MADNERPTRTQAIKRFLDVETHPDLASLYNHNMEVQANVAQEGGRRVEGDFKGRQWHAWTDGVQTWKSFRIPYKAKSEPEYIDVPMSYDFGRYVEGIGMTGWDWVARVSRWVAFDFDAITGHSDKHTRKLSEAELDDVATRMSSVPWCTVRRSTSGKGLHLYVMLNPYPTVNHTEHAALARAILGQLSALTRFDFSTKVDICVPSYTWTMTTDGPRQVSELIGKPTTLLVNGQAYHTDGFFFTKKEQVFELVTEEGYKVQATKNHPILTQYGGLRLLQELGELEPGDKVCLQKHLNFGWHGEGHWNEGYILGWLIGDGYCSENQKGNRQNKNGICLFPDDHCLLQYLCNCFDNPPTTYLTDAGAYLIMSSQLEELCHKYGIESDKQIGPWIEKASSQFCSGLVSGFFDSDGTADKDHSHVSLSQSNLPRLEAVQRILLRFGIVCKVRKEREAGTMWIQGREVKTQNKYVLTIGRENVLAFNRLIGFHHPIKRLKNQDNVDRVQQKTSGKKKHAKEHFLVTVKSVKLVDEREVYDVTVPQIHLFDANGITISNCGGNMWIWHRKMKGTNGLQLLKAGTTLDEVPLNWRDHLNVVSGKRRKTLPMFIENQKNDRGDLDAWFDELTSKQSRIPLDEGHQRLIQWLRDNNSCAWWDQDHWMLVTHTSHLKAAHEALNLKGKFDTSAIGSEAPYDHNCFAFPMRKSAWAVRRYTPGVSESSLWDQDGANWTRCFFNKEPDLKAAAKAYEGLEHPQGGFSFKQAELAKRTAELLGANIELPAWIMSRTALLKEHKDGRLVFEIDADPQKDVGQSGMDGWIVERNKYKRVFDVKARDATELDVSAYDDLVRHVVTPMGDDCGWLIKSEGNWKSEPLTHVKHGLGSMNFNAKEINLIVGTNVMKCWTLVNRPFQDEYPSGREWNRNAAQLRFRPSQNIETLSFPNWLRLLSHIGLGLDKAVSEHPWCKANGILTGGDYLKCWIASLFQHPLEPLPYLFFFGEQGSGKSIFHEALTLLVTHGVVRADQALTSTFNGELANAIVCVVEETDLRRNKPANNKIKDWVTARQISIRALYQEPYMIPNATHWVQCSNDHLACPIFPGDTRIVYCQVPPLKEGQQIPRRLYIPLLEKEAPDFLAEVLNLEIPSSPDRLNIPVITTQEKLMAEEANQTVLQTFIKDMCHHVTGNMIKFSEFYDRFVEWLDPLDRSLWTKNRTGKELPPQHPRGRVARFQGQHFIGNISWTPYDPSVPIQPRLIRREEFLVPDHANSSPPPVVIPVPNPVEIQALTDLIHQNNAGGTKFKE